MISKVRITVPTADGPLNALLHVPNGDEVTRGLVMVDGSGDGTADGWGTLPELLADSGVLVLTHDKPGCGGSPGDWRQQTLHDRAAESMTALGVLRERPELGSRASGFYGVSQGGWVSLIAATQADSADFLINISGPGVSPACQDRFRIENDLHSEGYDDGQVSEALGWIDERGRSLTSGEEVEEVLRRQREFANRPWYSTATRYFDDAPMLSFISRILDFEPAEVLPAVHCPVLALFGAADPLVPIPESVAAYLRYLPATDRERLGLAVFPAADHGLFSTDPHSENGEANERAAGFLPSINGFLDQFKNR